MALNRFHMDLRYFDVSLRDGLQSLAHIYSLPEKKRLLQRILYNNRPNSIEVGSLVSPKVLPQMRDSLELYRFALLEQDKMRMRFRSYSEKKEQSKIFLLVPPTPKYIQYAKNEGVKNISLITSVSELFQQKNTKQSLNATKLALKHCLQSTDPRYGGGDGSTATSQPGSAFENAKLYISCITQCPISGQQDPLHIVNEVLHYANIPQISELCLADTCGTLKFADFKFIVDFLQRVGCLDIKNKLSLHLHVRASTGNSNNQPELDENLDAIIQYAIKNEIFKFDVSSLENSGGCSVTMPKELLTHNLTYERLYRGLTDIEDF